MVHGPQVSLAPFTTWPAWSNNFEAALVGVKTLHWRLWKLDTDTWIAPGCTAYDNAHIRIFQHATNICQVDKEVGTAIRESGIPRSEIFVTSKFWPHFAAPENVELCLDQVLENMGLDYVDLFLAHWPCALKPISREALAKAVTGPEASDADRGMMNDSDGKVVVDWEHTSGNLAKLEGESRSIIRV